MTSKQVSGKSGGSGARRRRQWNGITYAKIIIRYLADCTDYVCQICGTELTLESAEIDHIVERQDGGADEMRNLQIVCYPCNRWKSRNRPVTKFDPYAQPAEILLRQKFPLATNAGRYPQEWEFNRTQSESSTPATQLGLNL